MCLLGQFISKCQTRAQFRALEGVPLPATNSDHEGTSSSLRLTSWPLGVLRGQLACQWTRPSSRNWDPFVPGLLLTRTTGQSAPTDTLSLFLKLISVIYFWMKIICLMTCNQEWKKTQFKRLSPTWMEGLFIRSNYTTAGWEDSNVRAGELAQDVGPDSYDYL